MGNLLDALVNVQITAQTAVPTSQGFGTPLFFVYHTKYSSLLKAYTDPDALLDDGFTVNDSAFKMAEVAWSQTPHPPQFFIGRRQQAFTQTLQLTLANTGSLGYEYSFSIVDDAGSTTAVAYASTGTPATDATTIFTLLTAEPTTYSHTTSIWTPSAAYQPFIANGRIVQIGGTPPTGYSASTNYFMIQVTATTFKLSATKGGSPVVATATDGTTLTLLTVIHDCAISNPSGGMLEFISTPGSLVQLKGLPAPAKSGPFGTMLLQDITTDPGIVADLIAVEAIDSTSWYGVAIDSNSKAEIEALAAHIEAQTKVFFYETTDSDVADNAASTDVMSALKLAGYTRTCGWYLANDALSWLGVGVMVRLLATQPGASTAAWMALAGITRDTALGGLVNTITSIAGAAAKNGNVYVDVAALGTTLYGLVPAGEFIDVPIFIDWLKVGIQSRIQITLANATAAGRKVPYTDQGTAQIAQCVQAQLAAGQVDPNPGFTPGSTSIVVPKVASISPTDKGHRVYGPITFSGQLSGSINNLTVTGTVTN